MNIAMISAGALALALGACSTDLPDASNAPTAHVTLAPASGSQVSGNLTLVRMGDGLQVTGQVTGLTPGSTHAIHIHENGDCSAPDASSAGGHFNPGGEAHGKVDSSTHHAGDMNNLVADSSGNATVDLRAIGPSLGTGAASDAMGRAVIVHADADDYTSQPSGNAGARVACGVITAG